ncbi:MAG: pyridoxamine 5'-phosphate oxidase [Ectothiorhodospiraceae bacterium]|nr:pyridoxamine 5'-phosphate oxidase [Ectothiorhodospiraceae bacterium]MCH8505158.1 pyridoxamine 5'-phosphate oxidase [Ectothiorhodospiraceae bacterium]
MLEEAVERFQALLNEARRRELPEPTAMTLATAWEDGRPSARTVLLKSVDSRGFVFYTNRRSRKGRQITVNPLAALCFLWQPMGAQVLVEGNVEAVSDEEADAYFASRPRQSQIGAWASHQSEPLDDRSALEQRVRELEQRYDGQDVPRPAYWSGYRVVPSMIEFWNAREGRLHDRERYQRQDDGDWVHYWLNP